MRETILLIFVAIVFLFSLFLLLQTIGKKKFCALCVSISLTWFALLILYWLKVFDNPVLIAILLGSSVTGFYYLIERKTKKLLHLFRLPFFLTLVFFAYLLLGNTREILFPFLFLVLLWAIFFVLYLYRENPGANKLINRLLECCKRW